MAGRPLDAAEVAGIDQVRAALDGELGERLAGLLTPAEVAALAARCDRLLRNGPFPGPSGDMPALPWPLF